MTTTRTSTWDFDPRDFHIEWNQRTQSFQGEPVSLRLPAEIFLKHVFPPDRQSVHVALVDAIANQARDLHLEFRVFDLASRSVRTISTKNGFEYSSDGELVRMRGSANDVTARCWNAEEARFQPAL